MSRAATLFALLALGGGASIAGAAPASAAGPGPLRFEVAAGSVTPKPAIYDGLRPIRVKFRVNASRPVDVAVELRRRGGGTVRRLTVRRAAPGRARLVVWDGQTDAGRAAPEGLYEAFVGRRGHRLERVSAFRFLGHLYPVAGPHGTRGYTGTFGAPRSGGRVHEGFDVTAACGTPIVTARGGVVKRSFYDPELYGNAVLIAGRGERRTYFYSHLLKAPLVGVGQRVRTGQRLGAVGQTGNAAGTPCHLHFELRLRGALVDPEPYLASWPR